MQQQRHQPRRSTSEVVEDNQPATTAGISSPFLSFASTSSLDSSPSRALSFARSSGFLASSPLLPSSCCLPPSLAVSPSDSHPPTASSSGIPCTHRPNVSTLSVPPLSFVILPRSSFPAPPSHPRRPVADHPSDPFQPCLILATVYYARTNRAAHVGLPRESVQPSPRAPPSSNGSRSGVCTSRYSPAISRAQFSPGDRPVRTGDPGTTPVHESGFVRRDDASARHEADARLASLGPGGARCPRDPFSAKPLAPTRSSIAPGATRCGWLVLMRKRGRLYRPPVTDTSVVVRLLESGCFDN